jgi:hypothetical protein
LVFGFDALVASLVLVLPGFIVVGTVVELAPSWERFKPNPAAYVLLSLGASVPLHLIFLRLASLPWDPSIKPWFTAFNSFDFSSLTRLAFAVDFLRPLLALLILSILSGVAIVGLMRIVAWLRSRDGRGVPSQRTVWRQVFEPRVKAPNVVVMLVNKAYKGQVLSVSTTDTDPHIYLTGVSVMPIAPTSGLPDWKQQTPLAMDGMLVKQSDIHEIWLLRD